MDQRRKFPRRTLVVSAGSRFLRWWRRAVSSVRDTHESPPAAEAPQPIEQRKRSARIGNRAELFVAPLDGSRCARSSHDATCSSWSPEGKRIASCASPSTSAPWGTARSSQVEHPGDYGDLIGQVELTRRREGQAWRAVFIAVLMLGACAGTGVTSARRHARGVVATRDRRRYCRHPATFALSPSFALERSPPVTTPRPRVRVRRFVFGPERSAGKITSERRSFIPCAKLPENTQISSRTSKAPRAERGRRDRLWFKGSRPQRRR